MLMPSSIAPLEIEAFAGGCIGDLYIYILVYGIHAISISIYIYILYIYDAAILHCAFAD